MGAIPNTGQCKINRSTCSKLTFVGCRSNRNWACPIDHYLTLVRILSMGFMSLMRIKWFARLLRISIIPKTQANSSSQWTMALKVCTILLPWWASTLCNLRWSLRAPLGKKWDRQLSNSDIKLNWAGLCRSHQHIINLAFLCRARPWMLLILNLLLRPTIEWARTSNMSPNRLIKPEWCDHCLAHCLSPLIWPPWLSLTWGSIKQSTVLFTKFFEL